MGAAIIGGVGAGVLPSFSAAEDFIQIERTTRPRSENKALYQQKKDLLRKVYRTLSDNGIFELFKN